jgi:hypothetical protein
MIRFLLFLMLAGALAFLGATVKLGNRTFFGHVRAVWATDEAQDMKQGVEQSAKPMLQKVKRGVEAGYREATRDDAPGVTRPQVEKPDTAEQPDAVEQPDAGAPLPAKKRHHRHAAP